MPPEAPEHDASACVGRLGFESFASPTFFCHAVRIRLDPETETGRCVAQLETLRGIGSIGAWSLATEIFGSRQIRIGRELGSRRTGVSGRRAGAVPKRHDLS